MPCRPGLPHVTELLCGSLGDALASADTVVITRRWPCLEALTRQLRADQRIVDLVGLHGADALGPERYAGIGW